MGCCSSKDGDEIIGQMEIEVGGIGVIMRENKSKHYKCTRWIKTEHGGVTMKGTVYLHTDTPGMHNYLKDEPLSGVKYHCDGDTREFGCIDNCVVFEGEKVPVDSKIQQRINGSF